MSKIYDIVIVGGGYNGLVVVCYLVKVGCSVCVVEKNDKVGGGVMICELIIFGFKYDVCLVVYMLLQVNLLLCNDELELKVKFGLKYINFDKMIVIFYDDGSILEFYIDLECICQVIVKFFECDVDVYCCFNYQVFQNFDMLVMGMFNMLLSVLYQVLMMEQSQVGQELMCIQVMSVWDYISEWFENDKVKIVLVCYVFEVMMNLFDNGIGFGFYIILLLMYCYGVGILVGGFGVFVDVLCVCLEYYGGEVCIEVLIKQFKIDGGKVSGVIFDSGEEIFVCQGVIFILYVKQVFFSMVFGCELFEGFEQCICIFKYSSFQLFNMYVVLCEVLCYKVGLVVDDFFWVECLYFDFEEFVCVFCDLEYGILCCDFIVYVIQDIYDKICVLEGRCVFNMYVFCFYYFKGGVQCWDEIGEEVVQVFFDDLCKFIINMDDDNIFGFLWMILLDIECYNNVMIGVDILYFGFYFWQIVGNCLVFGYVQYKLLVDGLYLVGVSIYFGGGVIVVFGCNVVWVLLEEFGLDFDELVGV